MTKSIAAATLSVLLSLTLTASAADTPVATAPAAEDELNEQTHKLSEEFLRAMRAGENDKALATLDALATLNPKTRLQYSAMRLTLLIRKKDYVAANTLAASVATSPEGDAVAADLATRMLNATKANGQLDMKVALELASKAYAANKDVEDANGVRGGWKYQLLLAKAYAANEQYGAAAQQQADAIGKLPAQLDAKTKAREEKTLAEYKAKATGGEDAAVRTRGEK